MSFTCDKETTSPCEFLIDGVVHFDATLAQSQIRLWLDSLQPQPTTEDPIGHEANLQSFVQDLKTDCGIEASIECYACIETFPVLSHVTMNLDSAGISVYRVLDIVTPTDSIMSLRDIHQ
jgi:hypothetical protein